MKLKLITVFILISHTISAEINPFLYERKFRVVQGFGPYETKDGKSGVSMGAVIRSEKEIDIICPGEGKIIYLTDEHIQPFLYINKPFSLVVIHFENNTGVAIFNIKPLDLYVGKEVQVGDVLGTTRDRHNLIQVVAIKSDAPYGKLNYKKFLSYIELGAPKYQFNDQYYDPFEFF